MSQVDFSEEYGGLGHMRLYAYRKPGVMDPETHGYTDDVAVTFATRKSWAVRHFRQIYSDVDSRDVNEVLFNADGIAILTNY